jgi:hypothetical protein
VRGLLIGVLVYLMLLAPAGAAPQDLNVYWQFTSPENIRGLAHEYADLIEGDPDRAEALWIRIGKIHVVMTPHPPEEPAVKFSPEWWNWVRKRARWFDLWLHEYSHATRDSPAHSNPVTLLEGDQP